MGNVVLVGIFPVSKVFTQIQFDVVRDKKAGSQEIDFTQLKRGECEFLDIAKIAVNARDQLPVPYPVKKNINAAPSGYVAGD